MAACIKSKSELLALQKKFGDDASIGMQFGISKQAVNFLRAKYGIGVSDKKQKRNKEIVTRFLKGVKIKDLSKKYSLTLAQIYRIVKIAW